MRQAGVAAEALERHAAIAAQLAHPGAEKRDRIAWGLLAVA
jgi:hypothetical protein